MNILFLTKRYYTSSDILADRFGRMYEIPASLARLGHTVDLVCHSYRHGTEETRIEVEPNFAMTTFNLGMEPLSGLWRHYRRLEGLTAGRAPDVIVAASDSFQIFLGSALARRLDVPLVADLYDNFASFGGSRLPGVLPLFSRALR